MPSKLEIQSKTDVIFSFAVSLFGIPSSLILPVKKKGGGESIYLACKIY